MITEEDILDYFKILNYQDKIKLINKIVPLTDFNNQRYRDRIIRDMFSLPDTKGYYGPDSPGKSFKTATTKPTKKGIYNVNKGTTLGILGRMDKEDTHDNLDTIFGLFSQEGEIKFVLLVHANDNFDNLFKIERKDKQKKMKNGKNKYDGITFNLNLILKYELSYEIFYKGEDVRIKI
jgi:hypothetical protein